MSEPPQRTKCKRLAEELERSGFASRYSLYNEGNPFESCVVDYGDPKTEAAIRREFPMMERVEDYATFSSRGSLEFKPHEEVRGEVPVSTARPIGARGFERREVYPPKKCAFDDVHLHVWDHQAATHFHVSCKDPDIYDLLDFIKYARDIARTFIKY